MTGDQRPSNPSAPMSGTNRHGTVRSTAGPSGVRTTTWRSCSHLLPTGTTRRPRTPSCSYRASGKVGAAAATAIAAKGACSGRPRLPSPTMHVHAVAVSRGVEQHARTVGKRRDPLDRVHLAGELGEHRGLVAGAGADIEDAFRAVQLELLADSRHHVRLRDRLTLADGQRRVGVRTAVQLRRHEQLARHAFHGAEHALVGDAARAQLPFDHRVTLSEHRR